MIINKPIPSGMLPMTVKKDTQDRSTEDPCRKCTLQMYTEDSPLWRAWETHAKIYSSLEQTTAIS